MKKLMLSFASLLIVGLVAVNAQYDTTKRPTQGSQPQQQNNQMNQKKDLVKVKTADLPASLRKTLEDPMYIGWENSTIYRNKTNEEYTVDIMTGNTFKSYRFDKNGRPLKDF
jgi:hypothetical protein